MKTQQFSARVSREENYSIAKAKEKAAISSGSEYVTMFAELIHDDDAYNAIKPHIMRLRNKGMR